MKPPTRRRKTKHMAKRGTTGSEELVFTALGGIGEIGMNLYLYGVGAEHDHEWLMVDLGITFPGDLEPGVDVIMPDIRFIEERRKNLKGILLTHGHEDHIGAVIDLWPRLKAPIYTTPFTAALLKAKLAEDNPDLKLPITIIPLDSRTTIGPFDVELVSVAHSIPEPNAVIIKAAGATIVHTADWKLDRNPMTGTKTNEARLKEIGAEGVDVLVCDSTNVLRDGVSPSEEDVCRTIGELIGQAKGRVAVTTFASNVARIRAVGEAAKACGRELVVCGRAMHRIIEVAKQTGYIPKDFRFLDQDAFQSLRREKVVALLTGSQGEPRAALARIAAKEHPVVSLTQGDTVIFSSRTIPGNEEGVGRIQNQLSDQQVKLITDTDALVHVTGHPRRGELIEMYGWIKPKALMPMHGEARHLEEQGRLGLANGIKQIIRARNGHLIRLAPGVPEKIDDVPVGRVFRDGDLLIDSEEGSVKERRKLAFSGIVVVAIAVEANGELAGDVQVLIDGVPEFDHSGASIEDAIIDAVEGALQSIPRGKRKDQALVRDAAGRAARAAVNTAWGKKPICKVLVVPV